MDGYAAPEFTNIEAYLDSQLEKSLLRFITCGSVDDGKSTLIGRLLYDSKMIFEDQLASLESDSKRIGTQGQELDYALLVDGLAAEATNDRAAAGNGWDRIGLLPRGQVGRVVGYAREQGVLRYAVLAPDTPYGRQVVDDLAEVVAAVGEVAVVVSVAVIAAHVIESSTRRGPTRKASSRSIDNSPACSRFA